MSICRHILVTLIALSLALLPVAGGMAVAMPHDASFTTAPGDCCPNGKPCEKKTDGCGSMSDCVLKCFSLTAVVVAPVAVGLTPSALEKRALVAQDFRSPAENPPLPPPRV